MTQQPLTRRSLIKASAALAGAAALPCTARSVLAQEVTSPNDRWRIGSIGMRYQGTVIAREATAFGDIVGICDVDRNVREQARASFGSTAKIYENYHDLIARDDIDVITIGVPDHWHAKMLIDAVRSGKDVYCEKPLTLTIDEGKAICRAVEETGQVVQVGTWQRSDERFRLGCELVQAGRIGNLQKVTVVLGKNVTGGPFETRPVPASFNWDLWQGQTPDVPYIEERSHYTFRWWYEYSGGQMTDWGAHHIDIAQWGAGVQDTGPVHIEGTGTFPHVENGYNVAIDFRVAYRYGNGLLMEVLDAPNGEYTRNGVMFEGDAGRIFVNRGTVAGKPVEDLSHNPFGRADFRLYAHDNPSRPERFGKIDAIKNHMANLYDCTISRERPLSSVFTQHRSVSVCHLGNISMRLGRPLNWDPESEEFVDDAEANSWRRREQRSGFEVV